MGYMFATSPCYGCGTLFTYAPTKVPSIRVEGVKHPICLSCIERVNPMRIKNGLKPIIPIEGAYEPEDENNG